MEHGRKETHRVCIMPEEMQAEQCRNVVCFIYRKKDARMPDVDEARRGCNPRRQWF